MEEQKPTIKSGIYQHYKGHFCIVLGLANHSETLEPLVVYIDLKDSPEFGQNALWVRPYSMFIENVEFEGKILPRFKFIG